MTIARQRIGREGERLAAARLAAAGWRIVERNARTREGELDIVALDRGTLVFVEVKAARAGAGPMAQMPELAVGPLKQRRLRRLAAAWLAERGRGWRFTEIRFDVIGVTFGAGAVPQRYEHVRAAF
jgi:putative endonuclease